MPNMSATPELPAVRNDATPIPEISLIAGVALSSFAALLLELGLTRVFSVVLFYHFAFLAISIALLGLGAGGVFAFLRKNLAGAIRYPKPGGAALHSQCGRGSYNS